MTHSDAVLGQEGANLVDYSGALADEPASDAVERLKIELLVKRALPRAVRSIREDVITL